MVRETKRRFAWLLPVCIVLFLLAACSQGAAGSGQGAAPAAEDSGRTATKKIKVMYINDPPFWTDQAKEFTKATGIQVEYESLPFTKLHDTMVTAFAGGSSDYDIVHVRDDWVAEFAPKGFLTPLDELLTSDMKSRLPERAFKALTYSGKIYGVPRYTWPWQFYYNKKIFEAAGIASPPKTWEELIRIAQKINQPGVYPYAEAWGEKFSYTPFIVHLRAQGGEFWNYDKGVPSFNSPEGIAALQLMADMNLKFKIASPGSLQYTSTSALSEPFAQGKVAMVMSSPGTYNMANDPKLSTIVGQAEVSVIPGAALKTASYAETGGLAIPASSKNKEAAFEFIKFVTGKDQQVKMAMGARNIPVDPSAVADPQVTEKYPFMKAIPEQMQYPYEMFKHEKASAIADEVSKHVTAAVSGKETPEQALKAAEENVLRIIGK
ncbi:ABC transporter substrate-binding protein [Paenibacillus hamazuiensis]|uniref:ABC transporter substrate-binding protein n=1 Tax=Paenibacillus hamazuiensis TaxID=2936508 RepID=UPI00200F59AC|nr:sugar ABC transporter substrate-binding protein [Paenibacillus hamazuiensis]